MTCPTTACFSGFNTDDTINVGGALRYFGDGHQIGKKINNERYWRIPVFDGEFIIQESFGVKEDTPDLFKVSFLIVTLYQASPPMKVVIEATVSLAVEGPNTGNTM